MQNTSSVLYKNIVDAAHDNSRVKGATHRFYRYPARFSPEFVRACIREFTEPGDLVIDPFVGGGTTLVEAMLLGRRSLGSDVNALATFVSRVKTTPLSDAEIDTLQDWFAATRPQLKLNGRSNKPAEWDAAGYFRNVDCPETWRHQKVIQIAIENVELLENQRCAAFVRCVILRTAQLALDGRKILPTVSDFRHSLTRNFDQMLNAAKEFSARAFDAATHPAPEVVKTSAASVHELEYFRKQGKPRLVLTSPPYPGVHVLYHRWQVRGRRETSAPYWIANQLDGDGERYYTLGSRHERELRGYFENLGNAFSSIARLVGPCTVVVQMVAFSEPEWQLPKYLEVMERCGLKELNSADSQLTGSDQSDARLWRDVPNRKWHASQQQERSGARELVLFHRAA